MAEDFEIERTHPASPRRRQQVRADGEVARSGVLVSAVLVLGVLGTLGALAPRALEAWRQIGARMFSRAELSHTLPAELGITLREVAWLAAEAVAPILLLAVLIAAVANVAQFGLVLSPRRLRPRLDAIDPMQNAGRIFSGQSWARLIIAIIRSAVVLGVAWLATQNEIARVVALPGLALSEAVEVAGALVLAINLKVAVVLLVFGLIDFAWRWWRFEQNLMLTPEQAREEARRMDGDPQRKARRQQLALQMAQARADGAQPWSGAEARGGPAKTQTVPR